MVVSEEHPFAIFKKKVFARFSLPQGLPDQASFSGNFLVMTLHPVCFVLLLCNIILVEAAELCSKLRYAALRNVRYYQISSVYKNCIVCEKQYLDKN